jgi:acetyltransferase-like isoleucine patch superfamily enzyme
VWVFRLLERWRRLLGISAGRMRAGCLALRGGHVGRKVYVGPRCTFDRPWCITLDERVWIESDVFVKVTSDEARIEIGAYSFIGRGTEIDASRSVVVGVHSLVAPRCFLTDHSHNHSSIGLRLDEQGCEEAPVSIGSDVWLGTGAVVFPGVNIGDRAIIGAQSVVRGPVGAGEIHAGVPARSVGRRG